MNYFDYKHEGGVCLSAGRKTRRLIFGTAATICVLLCCAVGCISASEDSDAATTFNDGTFTYEVNDDGSTVTVTGPVDDNIASVNIPSTVTDDKGDEYEVNAIATGAFNSRTKITTVQIPASIEKIGEYAFLLCTAIESFSVSEDNETYSSVDGVLFEL